MGSSPHRARADSRPTDRFTPSIAKRRKAEYRKSRERIGLRKKTETQLTSREAESLQSVPDGQLWKQIAAELGIRIKTVAKHRRHLVEKLEIHDVAGHDWGEHPIPDPKNSRISSRNIASLFSLSLETERRSDHS